MATAVKAPTRDPLPNNLQPCAATASFFAYAHGNSIICFRRDSPEIQKTLQGHSANICLLVADAQNQYSLGDIIFSYDESEVGIFWDLSIGSVLSRATFRQGLTAAAWVNKGVLGFGSAMGKITLYELSSAEHVSVETIISPISSLSAALSRDKLAIGYQSGTILITRLAPRFTILHSLSISGINSPIVRLSWHRSFTVLAAQNDRGDLCCWHTEKGPPKLTRKYMVTDSTASGPGWMEWSRNGHIVQLFNAQTPLAVRDVRTKHVRRTDLALPDIVKGLAIYSPDAMLFVLGAEHGIWQVKFGNVSHRSTVRHFRSWVQKEVNPALETSSHISMLERGSSISGDTESEAVGSLWSKKSFSCGTTSASSVIGGGSDRSDQNGKPGSISLKSDLHLRTHRGLQKPHEYSVEPDPPVTEGMGPVNDPEPGPRRFGTSVADFLTREFLGDQKLLEIYRDAAYRMERSLFVWNHVCLMSWYMFDRRRQGKTTEIREALAFHLSERDLLRMASNIFDFVASPEAQPRKANTTIGNQEKDIRLLLDRVLNGFNTDAEEIIHQATVEAPYFDGSSRVTSHESYWNTGTRMEFLAINEQLESHEDNPDRSLPLPPVTPTTPKGEDLASANGSNPTSKFGQASNSTDEKRILWAADNATPSTQLPETDRSFGHKFIHSAKRILSGTSWLARMMRPRLKEGYRRVEWTCDCGVELYADLCVRNSEQFENLARSLKYPIQSDASLEESRRHRPQSTDGSEEGTKAITTPGGHHDTQDSSNSSDGDTSSSTLGSSSTPSTPASTPTIDAAPSKSVAPNQPSEGTRSKFLALCVNTGGIYKTLSEVDLTGIKSDMAGFLKMKEAYLGTRGLRSRLRFLIKPVNLEFVQFTLWNRKNGYVSICNRPESIPPHTMSDYEYVPKPLEPLPPMPPEIFIHYLEHGEGELSPARHDWLPRLPLRLGTRVIDGEEASYGYGVHIIEGPNRMTIFWIFMASMVASILACVLWSGVKEDIQGGTSLGALIVALPAAVLAAFLFRFEGV